MTAYKATMEKVATSPATYVLRIYSGIERVTPTCIHCAAATVTVDDDHHAKILGFVSLHSYTKLMRQAIVLAFKEVGIKHVTALRRVDDVTHRIISGNVT